MSHSPSRDIRKVVLVEPSPADLHIFSRFALPRLGVVLLGTILRDLGHDVTVMVEDVQELDFDTLVGADLVGLSAISSTAGRSYAIADQLRAHGIPVVMGGPHVTHMADEAIEHCDYVVRGEGERALPRLIETLSHGGDLGLVNNLSWRDEGVVKHNALAPLEPDLDRFPDPDMSIVQGFRGAPPLFGRRRIVPIMTSRGCPHDCSFCSVTTTFGRKMRYRSVERVLAEMKKYDIRKTVYFIYDDNFAASPRRMRELLAGFRTLPHRPKWSAQVRADVARDEALLDEMKAAGCNTVFIGLESVNQESLESAGKRQDLQRVSEHLTRLTSRGISVHGMFVFGFDTDSHDTMTRTVAFARKHRLFSVQFLILTPLPGSRTHREMEASGRIMLRDWSLYDAHHVCFRPDHVTPAELQRWQCEGHERFYSLGEAFRRLLRGRLWGVALVLYAHKLARDWRRNHAEYLGVLDRLSTPQIAGPQPDFRRDFPELEDSVREALALAG